MEGGPLALPCFNLVSQMSATFHTWWTAGMVSFCSALLGISSFLFVLLVKPIFCPPAQYQLQSTQNMQILNWSNANRKTPRLLRCPTSPPTRSLFGISSGSNSSSKQQPQVPRPPTAFSWAIRPCLTWRCCQQLMVLMVPLTMAPTEKLLSIKLK